MLRNKIENRIGNKINMRLNDSEVIRCSMQNTKRKNDDPEKCWGSSAVAVVVCAYSTAAFVRNGRKGLFLTLLVNTTLIYESPWLNDNVAESDVQVQPLQFHKEWASEDGRVKWFWRWVGRAGSTGPGVVRATHPNTPALAPFTASSIHIAYRHHWLTHAAYWTARRDWQGDKRPSVNFKANPPPPHHPAWQTCWFDLP